MGAERAAYRAPEQLHGVGPVPEGAAGGQKLAAFSQLPACMEIAVFRQLPACIELAAFKQLPACRELAAFRQLPCLQGTSSFNIQLGAASICHVPLRAAK